MAQKRTATSARAHGLLIVQMTMEAISIHHSQRTSVTTQKISRAPLASMEAYTIKLKNAALSLVNLVMTIHVTATVFTNRPVIETPSNHFA